jgi:hypothetical protein
VPVLTVVIEDLLVREVALDADLVLGEMLGGRPLGRVLVNLLGVDRELGRFVFPLSRESPVDVDPLLRLSGVELDGLEGLAIPLDVALSRKEPAVEEFLDTLEETGLKGVYGLLGLAISLGMRSLRLLRSDMASSPVLRLVRLLPYWLGEMLDAAEDGADEPPKRRGNHNWSLPCSTRGSGLPEIVKDTVTIAWSYRPYTLYPVSRCWRLKICLGSINVGAMSAVSDAILTSNALGFELGIAYNGVKFTVLRSISNFCS